MPQRLLTLGLVGAVLVASCTWRLNAANQAGVPGLNGTLPSAVPADLTEAVAALPQTWSDWGGSLSADLSALYEKPLDASGHVCPRQNGHLS